MNNVPNLLKLWTSIDGLFSDYSDVLIEIPSFISKHRYNLGQCCICIDNLKIERDYRDTIKWIFMSVRMSYGSGFEHSGAINDDRKMLTDREHFWAPPVCNMMTQNNWT